MGLAFALSASLLWGIGAIFVSKATERVHPLAASFLSFVPGPIILVAAALITGQTEALFRLRPEHWFFFSLAGLLNFVLGRTFSFMAVQHIGASRASPLYPVSILFGPLSAIFLLGETVDLRTALGILAIFAGIVLVTTERRR